MMPLSFSLPRWIERLLGLSPADWGEGTQFSLQTAWLPAPWITFSIAAACLVTVAWVYHQQRNSALRLAMMGLALFRVIAIGLVLLMLTGVALVPQRTGLPYLVVVIDSSESMGIADRYDDEDVRAQLLQLLESAGIEDDSPGVNPASFPAAAPQRRITRLDLGKAVLLADDAQVLRDLTARYKLRVYSVSSSSTELAGTDDPHEARLRGIAADGATSRLGEGVRDVLDHLRGAPPAAVIVLSDGNTTDGESLAEAAREARRQQVPLFTVGLGSTQAPRNLAISDLLVDDVVFVNDVVNFEFKLDATGDVSPNAALELRDEESGETLSRLSVSLDDAPGPQTVRMPYRPPNVGEFRYVVEVISSEDEDATDNKLTASVSVRDDKIRVLMVQAFPNYEFRFLKHMFQRDGTIELNVVLQNADRGYTQIESTALPLFPVKREDLFAYDVIIFGDVDMTFLGASAIQNVHDFVTEKGGGLVMIAGPRYMPLDYRGTPIADLMPMDIGAVRLPAQSPVEGEFRVTPTELGLISPHMQLADAAEDNHGVWESLPTVRWFVEIDNLKPAARVLAEHPTKTGANGQPLPLFIIQYVGAGKVLFHATDETSRWRHLDFQEVEFSRYWVQAIRYLSRSKLLGEGAFAEVTTDRRQYTRGETVSFRVRFPDERQAPVEDDDVEIVIEREGDRQLTLPLRRSSIDRGVFEGRMANIAQGRYHAWVVSAEHGGRGPAADFDVVAPPGEFEKTQMNLLELREAATITGGRFYSATETGTLVEDIPQGRQIVVETLDAIPLWNHPAMLVLVLVLVVGEWMTRRMLGLL